MYGRTGQAFSHQVQEVNEYMRAKHIPAKLREKVRDYYNVRYASRKIFDEGKTPRSSFSSTSHSHRTLTHADTTLKSLFPHDM